MAAYLKNNVFVLGILLLINILGSYFYFRVDLTNDKRYSISSPSKSMLEELSDQVIIKVYLDGEDLPGGFERLKRAVKETLLEFKD